ncbi:hypothetical protein SRL2020472_56150 [Mycobacterium kiyosense]|nr:hypothetical protein SRL2020472_56150 [Mycobacterium kiyosense]
MRLGDNPHVARQYLTQLLQSVAVTESPIKHKGCPARTHALVARVWMVAGLMFGLASKSKSPSHFSRGNPAALTRRTERRRARSSHSANNNSAKNP